MYIKSAKKIRKFPVSFLKKKSMINSERRNKQCKQLAVFLGFCFFENLQFIYRSKKNQRHHSSSVTEVNSYHTIVFFSTVCGHCDVM
jgi:hypothetical protein